MQHRFRRGRRDRPDERRPVPEPQHVGWDEAPSDPPPPVLLGGRYELIRAIGEGGEASVHVARDRLLGREVAVKLFHERNRPTTEDRAQQVEARVGAALNHYALTALFDAGVERLPGRGPQLYLVMELVRGESLKVRLARGPMTAADVCWMGFDLAEGLDYMHQSGFLHRDVKPANVLISGLRSVRPVVAKLTDFGIAAPIGEPDLSEFTVGTAAYLSPEQVEGRDAGPASDVYSLGLSMLEALTGRREFPGTVEQSAFERLVRDPAVPDELSPALADLLRRMTARRPEERVDPHEVAVRLQQHLVDVLVDDRGDGGAAPTAGGLERGPAPADPGQARLVLRLAVTALGATAAALVLERPHGLEVVDRHGDVAVDDAVLVAAAEADDPSGRPRTGAARVVVGPDGARAVAAAPLLDADGARCGALVVLADPSHRFAEPDLVVLRDLAAVLSQDMELRAAMRRALLGAD